MSSDKPSTLAIGLRAASGLGTADGAPPRLISDADALLVWEELGVAAQSLRRSRITADDTWLARQLKSLGLSVPAGPRRLSGDEQLACAHIEPHAWLLTGQVPAPGLPGEGWLVTNVSARLACFRLTGPAAIDVLSSGGNLHGLEPGMACRVPFAQSVTVLIQRFAAADFRLLVDVSYAPFMADWLADAATHHARSEEQL